MVGWEQVKHYSRPKFAGVVICEENEELVIEAWRQDNERKLQQEARKASERALSRWAQVTRLLLAKNKIASTYLAVEVGDSILEQNASGKPARKGKKASSDKSHRAWPAILCCEPLYILLFSLRQDVGKPVAEQTHEHSFPKEKWVDVGQCKVKKICACGFELIAETL